MKPHQLPAPDVLKKRWQSLAMLDAIVSPEWEYRYFSFDAHWSKGEMLGSMRNGQGSAMHCLFADSGTVLSGFDIEQKKAAFALKPSDLPAPLSQFAREPAFDNTHTSFCFHRVANSSEWINVAAKSNDRFDDMLSLIAMSAREYVDWALEYFEAVVPVDAAERIFATEPLTAELARAINAEAALQGLRKDAKEIGYAITTKSA